MAAVSNPYAKLIRAMAAISLTTRNPHPATDTPATIIVPCTARKSMPVPREGSAVSLPISSQYDLETAWLERVSSFARTVACAEFYSGRGMALARAAAASADARMYVVSAGLGLVAAQTMIPPYAVTVGARGDDAVAAKTIGRFDPRSWWRSIRIGPCSSPMSEVFAAARSSLVLVALSRPYAEMLAEDLANLPEEDLVGLRLFGWRLEAVLEDRLHDAVMPYDARLDAVKPGTRCDYPQRALLHFVQNVGTRPETVSRHRAKVVAALEGATAPERPDRPRVDDGEIVTWITSGGNATGGIGASLRSLRSLGIACEQKRFSRLYREAMGDVVAA